MPITAATSATQELTAQESAPCPLCACTAFRRGWLGSICFRGKEFCYAACCSCGSLYCDPMPDDETLASMYGPDYGAGFNDDPSVDDPKEPGRVVAWLESLRPGMFIDYGCGSGALLVEAKKRGWHAIGIEYDPVVAERVEKSTGVPVASDSSCLIRENGPPADVLHLGDVIEHLTALHRQMPQILRLIKPGGVLLAQGPLEGNANLFTVGVRLARWLRPWHRTEMAPYHVLLATAKGQKHLFRRFGLHELEYTIREVSWPAPSSVSVCDIKRPRAVGLFILRRLSQAISACLPGYWGNRYFFAGRWNGSRHGVLTT